MCPHFRFDPKELKINSARCIGGDGSWIEHSPTGIICTLFMPEDGKRRDYLPRGYGTSRDRFRVGSETHKHRT